MKSIKNNNKGFTLIELLAVIVILGVLMIIAVPMVSQYITQARKDAFISTAKAYISSARYAYLNGDYKCKKNIDSASGGQVAIKFSQIQVDKTGGKSSFNENIDKEKSYVIINADGNGQYTYYVRMIDEGDNGWDYAISEEELERKNVINDDFQSGIWYKSGSDEASVTKVTDECTRITP